jgi:putative glutamine amidotransferase
MKRFAISLNVTMGHEYMDTLNHSYVTWCERMQVQPILIPNAISNHAHYIGGMKIDGVILTGGNDISGIHPGPKESSEAPIRDRTEEILLKIALENKLPVLGICRGMQFLNVYFGGNVLRNLSERVPNCEVHVGCPHQIQITHDKLAAYLQARCYSVNSFHNHGITSEMVAPTLDVFAVSQNDGVVEGVLHKTERILGIQWHPERQGSTPECDARLIAGFLDGAFWNAQPE